MKQCPCSRNYHDTLFSRCAPVSQMQPVAVSEQNPGFLPGCVLRGTNLSACCQGREWETNRAWALCCQPGKELGLSGPGSMKGRILYPRWSLRAHSVCWAGHKIAAEGSGSQRTPLTRSLRILGYCDNYFCDQIRLPVSPGFLYHPGFQEIFLDLTAQQCARLNGVPLDLCLSKPQNTTLFEKSLCRSN